MLGERANLPPALTPQTSAVGLPFVPYHDDELRRRRKGRPMRSAYAADSQVRCRALVPLILCRVHTAPLQLHAEEVVFTFCSGRIGHAMGYAIVAYGITRILHAIASSVGAAHRCCWLCWCTFSDVVRQWARQDEDDDDDDGGAGHPSEGADLRRSNGSGSHVPAAAGGSGDSAGSHSLAGAKAALQKAASLGKDVVQQVFGNTDQVDLCLDTSLCNLWQIRVQILCVGVAKSVILMRGNEKNCVVIISALTQICEMSLTFSLLEQVVRLGVAGADGAVGGGSGAGGGGGSRTASRGSGRLRGSGTPVHTGGSGALSLLADIEEVGPAMILWPALRHGRNRGDCSWTIL